MKNKSFLINTTQYYQNMPLFVIAGPCVIEDEAVTLQAAEHLKNISEKLRIPLIFKSSYRKDNRTKANSFEGLGLEKGLRILEKVKTELELPVLSDVHYPHEAAAAAEVLDVLQIPAYLCKQIELAKTLAKTGKPINIKKGQFLPPEAMQHPVQRIEEEGNYQIFLTERGSQFGYHDLTVDMRSFSIMAENGYPVIYDVTHSTRTSGTASVRSKHQFFAPILAKAAVAAGADGVFMETHPCPENALCDADTMLPLAKVEALLRTLQQLQEKVRET